MIRGNILLKEDWTCAQMGIFFEQDYHLRSVQPPKKVQFLRSEYAIIILPHKKFLPGYQVHGYYRQNEIKMSYLKYIKA